MLFPVHLLGTKAFSGVFTHFSDYDSKIPGGFSYAMEELILRFAVYRMLYASGINLHQKQRVSEVFYTKNRETQRFSTPETEKLRGLLHCGRQMWEESGIAHLQLLMDKHRKNRTILFVILFQ